MPVSRHRTNHDNANGNGHATTAEAAPPNALNVVRLQQARVLAALMPAYPDDPPFEWPLFSRAGLCLRAGFKTTSGSITRALNGIRPGNRTSGAPHPGLIERGFVEVVVLDIDGLEETNYRITHAGIRAFEAYLATGGELPEVKDAATCTNVRYRGHPDTSTPTIPLSAKSAIYAANAAFLVELYETESAIYAMKAALFKKLYENHLDPCPNRCPRCGHAPLTAYEREMCPCTRGWTWPVDTPSRIKEVFGAD